MLPVCLASAEGTQSGGPGTGLHSVIFLPVLASRVAVPLAG